MTVSSLYVLIGGILWGFIGIFVRLLGSSGLTPMDIVTIRSLGATLVFSLVLIFTEPRLFIVRLKDLWVFFAAGFISLAGFNYCNFRCITISSLGTAALLMYTAPVFVMLFSLVLFDEKITAAKLLSLLLTISGCFLITGITEQGMTLNRDVIVYGLASGVGYALYSIFSKFAVLRGYHPATIVTYNFFTCALAALFISGDVKIQHLDGNGWCGVLGIVLVCSLGANYFYTKGLRQVDAGYASILATAEPFVATIMGLFFFGEAISLAKVVGMVLILCSIVLLNKKY